VSGFFSNALNPKTTLFFLGIFIQLVTKDTPVTMQVVYGAKISLAHLLWFSLLSYLLTHQKILPKVKKYQTVVNRLMGEH
jgi:threonine/homoserine/homoserine lactone efflux protein